MTTAFANQRRSNKKIANKLLWIEPIGCLVNVSEIEWWRSPSFSQLVPPLRGSSIRGSNWPKFHRPIHAHMPQRFRSTLSHPVTRLRGHNGEECQWWSMMIPCKASDYCHWAKSTTYIIVHIIGPYTYSYTYCARIVHIFPVPSYTLSTYKPETADGWGVTQIGIFCGILCP